jgi:hypothetical protein
LNDQDSDDFRFDSWQFQTERLWRRTFPRAKRRSENTSRAMTWAKTPGTSSACRSTVSTAGRPAPWADFSYNEGIKKFRHGLERGNLQGVHQGPARQDPRYQNVFVEIKDDNEIGDLWAYLKQFATNGAKK